MFDLLSVVISHVLFTAVFFFNFYILKGSPKRDRLWDVLQGLSVGWFIGGIVDFVHPDLCLYSQPGDRSYDTYRSLRYWASEAP